MYMLAGLVGYLTILLVLGSVAHASATLTARWLGAAPFRWFDGRPPAVASWRRWAVRVVSSIKAVAVAVALLFFALLARGDDVATTRINVMPGPAEAAGLRDGDRILSIDSQPVASFDEIRTAVGRGDGEKHLSIQRGQQNLVIAVTPANGRIGVTAATYEERPIGVGAALERALTMPAQIAGQYLKRISGNEQVELAGPVAIVREVGKQRGSGSYLYLLAMIAIVMSPLAAGVHVFDELTLALFRGTHPWSQDGTTDPVLARLARHHQTLWLALICMVLLGVFRVLQETSFGDGAILGIFLMAPAALAGVLEVGIVISLRSGRPAGFAAMVASCLIPCAVLGIAGWVVFWLRTELSRRKLSVRGLIAEPAPLPDPT